MSAPIDKTPLIEVSNLTTRLGGQLVHKALNLTVYQQEILAIVGGSGSGKTTLLRTLLMLQQPESGQVRIFNQSILDCSPAAAAAIQKRWGVLFQKGALFSSLTVLENVMFPIQVFTDLPKELQHEVALLKIALTGLPVDAAHKYPAELSGGMLKRAALARALAIDPELLFLDEPTSGLDPKSAGAFDELILELNQSLKITIVMVTHDVDTLWRVPHRVAFLAEGKALAVLPIADLIKEPHPEIQAFFTSRTRTPESA